MTSIVNTTLTAILAGVVLANVSMAQYITVEAMPPSVIKTVPTCGDTMVPASTTHIKVTFSKDMMTKQMWSWCMHSPSTFPEISNKNGIKYLADKRTCVLPVKLEPNKTYAIWINNQKSNSFRDASGHPSIPYLLVFKTH